MFLSGKMVEDAQICPHSVSSFRNLFFLYYFAVHCWLHWGSTLVNLALDNYKDDDKIALLLLFIMTICITIVIFCN